MCSKGSTSSSTLKKKKAKKTRKTARRCRTKTRKPKFLSLSLELSSDKAQQSSDMPCSSSAATTTSSSINDHQQLNLFPLHQENSVDDKDNHDENMAYLFSAADGGASTLTGLLGAGKISSSGDDDKNQGSAELSPSASLSYAYGSEVKEAVALVRTALRNKERDSIEERYVRYSEVVEKRDEEVTSSAADLRCGDQNLMVKVEKQRLSLKLDYEEILNAWSDKSPLYVYAHSPQTVPDIHDNFLAYGLSYGLSDHGWGNHGALWSVPELARSNPNVQGIKKEEEQQEQHVGAEEWKLGQREASVLRYKEKRQNRLFSKRIRYQVRKLNAENRPRVKGRFVKRS